MRFRQHELGVVGKTDVHHVTQAAKTLQPSNPPTLPGLPSRELTNHRDLLLLIFGKHNARTRTEPWAGPACHTCLSSKTAAELLRFGAKNSSERIPIPGFRFDFASAFSTHQPASGLNGKSPVTAREIRFDPGTVFLRKRKWVEFLAANRDDVLRSSDGR